MALPTPVVYVAGVTTTESTWTLHVRNAVLEVESGLYAAGSLSGSIPLASNIEALAAAPFIGSFIRLAGEKVQ